MSAPQPRLLETYNSLTDKHLVGYFSNARIRRHLQKSGLISRSGRIIPEKEFRLNAIRRDQQRHVRQCLADAIFRKVLDMERHRQRDKRKKRDCSGRRDRRQPEEVERIRESLEEIIHVRCPHPPLAPRNHHGLCPFMAAERACCSHCRAPGLGVACCCGHCPYPHRVKETYSSKVSSLRPSTAPGNAQLLPRLRPLRGGAAAGAVPKAPRERRHPPKHEQRCARGGDSSEIRIVNSVEYIPVSPYQLPALCSRALPAPLRQRRGNRRVPTLRGALPDQRHLQPTTAFNEQVLIRNTRGFPKSPLCSNALVTIVYLGRSKHVSLEYRDEVKVYQQYCGTENICVYRGELMEGDTFQFVSKRHLGFPFSLTFVLNDTEVERLSSCCEYRHLRRPGPRGRNRYFRILHVAGAPPCYRCIVAMGLDKKRSPPKRKARSCGMKHVCPWEHAVHCERCDSSAEPTSREGSSSVITHGHGTSAETVEKSLETEEESSEEEMENQSSEEEEDSDENAGKNEYDEDFETYEEVNEEGQTGDQMNGMSKSPSDDKNHNLGNGKESETSFQTTLGASDREKDGSDGYSDDRGSGDDLQERGPADFVSSMSTQCSTQTASHTEMVTDNGNGQEDCKSSASDSAAHAHCGNESGEKELLRMQENQETSALEKKGIDEAEKTKPEDLTAREDTRTSHENIMAMQHQNPEVDGEFRQTGPGESYTNEEEKSAAVPWGSRVLDTEDGSEECPCGEERGVFEDCKPVQEEIAKASGNDNPVSSDPEPDSCANEEEKNTAKAEHGASGAPEGSSLAEGRSLAVQEAAGQEAQGGQVTAQGQALEQLGAAEAGGFAAGAGDSLPQAGTGAALEEPAPEDGTVAQEHPRAEGTEEAGRAGTGTAPGEQKVLLEGMETVAKAAARGQGPAGALPGREADRAVPQGLEGAGAITEEEAAEEELRGAEEQAGEAVPEAGQSLGQAGQDTELGAVSLAEEAVDHAGMAAGGAAGAGREEAAEENISEGEEEAVGKPGALWEALGNMETGEAMPGEEGFVKPSEFSQLKVSGEERMEMRKAGAAAPESAQAREVEGNALQRVGYTMKKSVEPDKGSVLEVAPELGAVGRARGDRGTEGSSQAEKTRAEEEEDAAETLGSVNLKSEGSKAETQRAMEGKAAGEAVGGSAEGSGGEEESADGAAGSEEPAAGTQGRPRSAKGTGQGRRPGEPGLSGTRAGEPGLVAIAVVGGQAGRGALAGELALAGGPAIAKEPAVAGAGGPGTEAMAQEGVTRTVLGTQSGTAAEERLGTPRHGEGLEAAPHGEQPSAGGSPGSPAPGDGPAEPGGTGAQGGERLCPGTPARPAAAEPGTARGTDGRQQRGLGQAARDAEGQQGRDSPLGGSPGALAAAGGGENSRSARQGSPACGRDTGSFSSSHSLSAP